MQKLLNLVGLALELPRDCDHDRYLAEHWTTVKDWSEQSRDDTLWRSDPKAMEKKARDLVRASDDPDHRVLQWLQESW